MTAAPAPVGQWMTPRAPATGRRRAEYRSELHLEPPDRERGLDLLRARGPGARRRGEATAQRGRLVRTGPRVPQAIDEALDRD